MARVKRAAMETCALTVARAVASKGIEFGGLVQIHPGIEEEGEIGCFRIAETVAEAVEGEFARIEAAIDQWELLTGIGRRTVGGVSVLELRGDVDITVFAHWQRSEEHTSELQSLMRISYAVFCLKKKKTIKT